MGVAVAADGPWSEAEGVPAAGRGDEEATGDVVSTEDPGDEQPARRKRVSAARLRCISRKTRRPDPWRGGAAGGAC
jgi:hypothetical protein